eukprot:1159398-Pelagomonas_calceolata.AAC.13
MQEFMCKQAILPMLAPHCGREHRFAGGLLERSRGKPEGAAGQDGGSVEEGAGARETGSIAGVPFVST